MSTRSDRGESDGKPADPDHEEVEAPDDDDLSFGSDDDEDVARDVRVAVREHLASKRAEDAEREQLRPVGEARVGQASAAGRQLPRGPPGAFPQHSDRLRNGRSGTITHVGTVICLVPAVTPHRNIDPVCPRGSVERACCRRSRWTPSIGVEGRRRRRPTARRSRPTPAIPFRTTSTWAWWPMAARAARAAR
jgi:hypothetical protein